MGSDFKRTLIWVVFLSALFLLWDSWQVYNGRPSFFGAAPVEQSAQASAADSAAVPAAVADKSAVPEVAGQEGRLIDVSTDLMKLTFDEQGASLVRAELLKMKELPKWNEVGLVGLILGNKEEAHKNVVLFDHTKEHFYEAQTGVIGAEGAPNHRSA